MVTAIGHVAKIFVRASEAKRFGDYQTLERLQPRLQNLEKKFAAGLESKKGLSPEVAQQQSLNFISKLIHHFVYRGNNIEEQAKTAANYYRLMVR